MTAMSETYQVTPARMNVVRMTMQEMCDALKGEPESISTSTWFGKVTRDIVVLQLGATLLRRLGYVRAKPTQRGGYSDWVLLKDFNAVTSPAFEILVAEVSVSASKKLQLPVVAGSARPRGRLAPRILDFLKDHGPSSVQDIAKDLESAPNRVQTALEKLRADRKVSKSQVGGLIVYYGRGRSGDPVKVVESPPQLLASTASAFDVLFMPQVGDLSDAPLDKDELTAVRAELERVADENRELRAKADFADTARQQIVELEERLMKLAERYQSEHRAYMSDRQSLGGCKNMLSRSHRQIEIFAEALDREFESDLLLDEKIFSLQAIVISDNVAWRERCRQLDQVWRTDHATALLVAPLQQRLLAAELEAQVLRLKPDTVVEVEVEREVVRTEVHVVGPVLGKLGRVRGYNCSCGTQAETIKALAHTDLPNSSTWPTPRSNR